MKTCCSIISEVVKLFFFYDMFQTIKEDFGLLFVFFKAINSDFRPFFLNLLYWYREASALIQFFLFITITKK
jgi:hypothetical protein